jgi:hypothetical protein
VLDKKRKEKTTSRHLFSSVLLDVPTFCHTCTLSLRNCIGKKCILSTLQSRENVINFRVVKTPHLGCSLGFLFGVFFLGAAMKGR